MSTELQQPPSIPRRRVWPYVVAGVFLGAGSSTLYFYHLWTRPLPPGVPNDDGSPAVVMVIMVGMFLIVCLCGFIGAWAGYFVGRLVRTYFPLANENQNA
jgi:hypothetical protein